MKHFIVCLIFCTILYQVKCNSDLISRRKIWEVRKQCIDEVGLGRIINKNFTQINKTSEVEHTRKCVRTCVAKKLELLTSEGKLDKDKILEKLISKKDMLFYEKFSEALTKCIDQEGNDICETHYLIMECMKEFRPFPRMNMNDI